MFLEIPVRMVDEETEKEFDDVVDINPFRIVAIERCDRKGHCVVSMTGDIYYEVRMNRRELKAKIKHFVEDNVLQRIYKEMKDN